MEVFRRSEASSEPSARWRELIPQGPAVTSPPTLRVPPLRPEEHAAEPERPWPLWAARAAVWTVAYGSLLVLAFREVLPTPVLLAAMAIALWRAGRAVGEAVT
jgi:hypothetical protein